MKEEQKINYANLFHSKQLHQQKMCEMPFEDGSLNNRINRSLIFTRVIGHKIDIPGSLEWHMHSEHNK